MKDFISKGKAFLKELSKEFVLEAVKGFILESIKNINAFDVYKAIKDDINLWGVSMKNHTIKEATKKLNQYYGGYLTEYQELITADLIIKWLSKDRPDIASIIINTEGGLEWITKQIQYIVDSLQGGKYE